MTPRDPLRKIRMNGVQRKKLLQREAGVEQECASWHVLAIPRKDNLGNQAAHIIRGPEGVEKEIIACQLALLCKKPSILCGLDVCFHKAISNFTECHQDTLFALAVTIARILLGVFRVANRQKLLCRQAGGNGPGLHVEICLQLVGRRLQAILKIGLVTDEIERKVPMDALCPKGLRNLQVRENGLEAENDVVVPGTEARRGIELFVGFIEDMKAVQVHELVVLRQHSLESLAKGFLAHVFRDEKVASFANCWIGGKFARTWPHELATHRTCFRGARLVGVFLRRLALSRSRQ